MSDTPTSLCKAAWELCMHHDRSHLHVCATPSAHAPAKWPTINKARTRHRHMLSNGLSHLRAPYLGHFIHRSHCTVGASGRAALIRLLRCSSRALRSTRASQHDANTGCQQVSPMLPDLTPTIDLHPHGDGDWLSASKGQRAPTEGCVERDDAVCKPRATTPLCDSGATARACSAQAMVLTPSRYALPARN